MQNRFLVALFLFCTFIAGRSLAACHAVGPTGAGDGSGSNWANRMNNLPRTLTRGDVYYLADGDYGKYTFSTPNSGTTTITIKKAQSYDYGRASDGCTNDISSGWNPSTMGAGQANWGEFYGGTSTPQPGYLILDGNGKTTVTGCGIAPTAATSASDCGLKITASQGQDSDFDIGANNNDGQHRTSSWTIRYFEILGGGDANNGAQSEEEIRCRGACDNFLVDHAYFHDTGCDFFKVPWTTAFTVQNSYIRQNMSSATCHGQLWYSEVNISNVDFHSNIIQDIQGTGIWVCLTGCQSTNINIYNNALWRTAGSNRPGTSNGIFSCINSGNRCTNWSFIGNTVVNYTADYAGALGTHCDGNPDTWIWKNNLFYGITPSDRIDFQTCGGSLTESNNTYLNSGTPKSGISSTDIVIPTGAPNPFVNWQSANFQLASQNSYWTGGATLGAPYNVDFAGNSRPDSSGVWNRGAYQYAGGAAPPTAPAAPTNLKGVVH
ncbi:hypothetical protein [Edaphobacter sp. 12200R-103]|jgi:hypothetical protein|uniref:hypothetical protein n=1 Tax=Edaphobacter sp. 12200R-103 TaxID=2703788 RepID=UPI00138BE0D0|nr:hypothetical protein [Edaphobacter sp. 12200R-103]QHS50705.1 hypothetical protein GWR55_02305 [Edaphobacter sp. 12200R-103]